MTAELPHHLQIVVETICQTGCQRVNEVIAILGDEGDTAETHLLSEQERSQVLAELMHIMSVYDQK